MYKFCNESLHTFSFVFLFALQHRTCTTVISTFNHILMILLECHFHWISDALSEKLDIKASNQKAKTKLSESKPKIRQLVTFGILIVSMSAVFFSYSGEVSFINQGYLRLSPLTPLIENKKVKSFLLWTTKKTNETCRTTCKTTKGTTTEQHATSQQLAANH